MLKFIKKEKWLGKKIWKAYYSDKNADLAVLEYNLILNN